MARLLSSGRGRRQTNPFVVRQTATTDSSQPDRPCQAPPRGVSSMPSPYPPDREGAAAVHHPIEDDLDSALNLAADLLRKAKRVAVLSGAGVSAESGVATFRGAGGLWEGHAVTEVATPEAFERDPALVWRFYNQRRAGLRGVQPNPGHVALAEMERRWGGERFTLCTQNIDGLHHAGGSRRVLELHGRLSRVRCTACAYIADRPEEELPDVPRCHECGELLRPDIVWFGEMLPARVW